MTLDAFLGDRLGRTVEVAYGRARTAPVQVVDDRCTVRVRLHRFFAAAPADVREALAAWLRAGRRARRACRVLDTWIDAQLAALPVKRRMTLRPRGNHHDLGQLAAPLLAHEFVLDFEGRPPPQLTWGRRGRSRARRSLLLGSFDPAAGVVRIHPVLDRPAVPAWFVSYVLFHELLHAALPGSRFHHGPDFCARERSYPDYDRALRWQRKHIAGLIRDARRGEAAPWRPIQTWLPF